MEMNKKGLNKLLREAREARGWRQSDLAERLGVSRATIMRWEQGSQPEQYHQDLLCQVFGLRPEHLGLLPHPEVHQLIDPRVPVSSPTLVGRNDLLTTTKKQFFAGQSVIALSGLPGVGKTALAVALAHDPALREHFSDGILWAGLGPEPNLSGIFSRWGTLFGVAAGGMGTLKRDDIWARILREMIGTRRFLIVLDDAWNLADAAALKVGGERCAYLLTTRHPALATEFASAGAMLLVPELAEDESIELLQQLAPPLQTLDINTNRTLVRTAGALPLALTLIGNHLRVQGASANSRRLQMAITRLLKPEERLHLSRPMELAETHPSLPIGTTSLSLHTLIAVSDQHMDSQAQSTLRALSIFPAKPNTFSEGAALAVSACHVEVLDALVDAGLLESSGPERYTLHQTIADYARSSRAETPTMIERVITHFISSMQAHSADYEALEADNNNILSILDLAYTRGVQKELVDGTCAFAPFLLARGLYEQAAFHLKRALEIAHVRDDTYFIGICLQHLGMVAQKQGEYQQATTYYQDALTLARKADNKQHICSLLSDLGWIAVKRGLYEQASTYAEEGVNLAHQINNETYLCRLLTVCGVVADHKGNYVQAEKYYREGLSIARQINDREQQCVLLIDLGASADIKGNYKESLQFALEAYSLAQQIGHLEWQCLTLSNCSVENEALEDFEEAAFYNREAIRISRQIGHREWMSHSLNIRGTLALRAKDYDQAEEALLEALTLARQIGKPYFICDALRLLGDVALVRQDINSAFAYFSEMEQTVPAEQPALQAEVWYRQGLVAAFQGDVQEAKKRGNAALQTMDRLGYKFLDEVRAWVEEGCLPSLPKYLR